MPKIKELTVNFISPVDQPANRKPIVYKSVDGRQAHIELALKNLRKDAKEGLIYGTVYSPNVVDTQGDWADAETIKKAAHDFLAMGKVQMVDMQHNYVPGAGTVVESFIKKGSHPEFADIEDGSWCVVIKASDDLKEKMDKIGGLSLAGTATFDETQSAPEKSVTKSGSARIVREASPARVLMPARVVRDN